ARKLPSGNRQHRAPHVLECEHCSGPAAAAEFVDVHVAEELADHSARFGGRHDLDIDLVTPTACDLQEMTVAARESARPGEECQQEARPRAQKPGFGERSWACNTGLPVAGSARGAVITIASASEVGAGSVLRSSCDCPRGTWTRTEIRVQPCNVTAS